MGLFSTIQSNPDRPQVQLPQILLEDVDKVAQMLWTYWDLGQDEK